MVVIAQRRSGQAAPSRRAGIHLPGRVCQNQRYIPPGQAGVGLQHQRHHARHHRHGGRGAIEIVAVALSGQQGGNACLPVFITRARIARGRTHRQVGAGLAVQRALAARIHGAYRHHAVVADVAVVHRIVAGLRAIAARKYIHGPLAAASLAQSAAQCRGQRPVSGRHMLEVARIQRPPAVAVDLVVCQSACQRIQQAHVRLVGQRVVGHQSGPGRHAHAAKTIVVPRGHDAGHRSAMIITGSDGQWQGVALSFGQIVVACARHHVGQQIVVQHVHPVVHHRQPDALAAELPVQLAQVQILAGHRVQRAAGIAQVPLLGAQRVAGGEWGGSRGRGIGPCRRDRAGARGHARGRGAGHGREIGGCTAGHCASCCRAAGHRVTCCRAASSHAAGGLAIGGRRWANRYQVPGRTGGAAFGDGGRCLQGTVPDDGHPCWQLLPFGDGGNGLQGVTAAPAGAQCQQQPGRQMQHDLTGVVFHAKGPENCAAVNGPTGQWPQINGRTAESTSV